MSYSDTTPRIADSNNNLLFKICQELSNQNGGAHPPRILDSDNNLLFKIAKLEILGGTSSAALLAQIAALQAQVTTLQTFDMGWEWTPTTRRLGNIFGYFQSSSDVDSLLGITSLTFKGTALEAGITLSAKQVIQSAYFPGLLTVGSAAVLGAFNFQNCPLLQSISAPSLTSIESSCVVSGNVSLTTFNLPSLTQFGSGATSIFNNTALQTLSLPSLITVFGFLCSGNTSLITLNLPVLGSMGASADMNASGCTNLVNVTLTSYIPSNGRSQNFSSCALSQASVDHVLARCVANAAYVSGTVTLNGGTNSTPSVAGLADKATLIARGCTVLTN